MHDAKGILDRAPWTWRWCFVGGCVLKTAWQEHYHSLPRSSFGWHDWCSSFWLAGTMPKAFLTEPHGPGGGASWAVASSKLLGRSTTTAYLDLPLADMIAARVLLSAWQAQCQRHSWQSPMDLEVVLRGRVRPQNCLAGALPKAVPRSSFGWHDCSTCSSFCLACTMPKAFLTEPHGPGGGASWAGASSKLLGRSITTAYLDLPLADMIGVLLSDWQAQCQKHAWQSPVDLEVVLRGRLRPQNCLAGALPQPT